MTDARTLPQPLLATGGGDDDGSAAARKPPLSLQLPSTEQGLRYAVAYWSATLRSLCGGHRVRIAQAGRYRTRIDLTDALLQRWQALFADGRGLLPEGCPLLVGQSVGSLLVARLFNDLGLNLRHVLHLSHGTTHPQGAAAALAARRLSLSCGLQRSVRMGSSGVLLVLRTLVVDSATHRCVAIVDDGFLVRCVPVADVAAAEHDRQVLRDLLNQRRRGCAIDPESPGVMRARLPIAADAAMRYGRVAGDLNPVHGGGLLARLLGSPRPVVQGLYLRNRVVRELAAWGCALERLSITFVNPVHAGQTLVLARQGERFELSTASGRLVALGLC